MKSTTSEGARRHPRTHAIMRRVPRWLYGSARGRSKVENLIIGSARSDLQRQFRGFTALISYWRDEAAHGKPSRLSDVESFTAVAMLLRFAQFVNDNWKELTE